MDRENLIRQVKSEYARYADMENKENFYNTADSIQPDAYYEQLLDQVLQGVEDGRFDHCRSGKEIVEAVANNKAKWGITI